ncbi:MAG: FAD:protein FMN transferase [Bdellovibrionota bacterium]|nr:FAD:protein FMN transferase [Bdellovibrionota bacterium]
MKNVFLKGRVSLFLFLFVVSGFFVACSSKPDLVQIQGRTMGTYYSVKYINDFPSVSKEVLKEEIERELKDLNLQMSTYMNDSEISLFNLVDKAKDFPISDDFAKTLKFSLEFSEKTEGRFDPTVYPLVNLWGFGPKKGRKVPSKDEIAKRLKLVGYDKIQLKQKDGKWFVSKSTQGTKVDLSASAKGYAVDKLSQILRSHQFNNHLVDIGGELIASGKKYDEKWTVAIEVPDAEKQAIQQVLAFENRAIATSGSYRNFFSENGIRYNHTIDPKTGNSFRSDLVSVSVITDQCLKSDAMATGLMAMGFEKAKKFALENKLEVYLIRFDEKANKFHSFDTLLNYKK